MGNTNNTATPETMAKNFGLVEIIATDKGSVFIFATEDNADDFAYRANKAFRGSFTFEQDCAVLTEVFVYDVA